MTIPPITFASNALSRREFLEIAATAALSASQGCKKEAPLNQKSDLKFPEGKRVQRHAIDDAHPSQAEMVLPQAPSPLYLSNRDLARQMFDKMKEKGKGKAAGTPAYKYLEWEINRPNGLVMAELVAAPSDPPDARMGKEMKNAGIKLTAEISSDYYHPDHQEGDMRAKEFFVNPNNGKLYGVTYILEPDSNTGVMAIPTQEDAKQAQLFIENSLKP